MEGVFLPLIFWCLKVLKNGGSGKPHLVGLLTDLKTPLHPQPIISNHSEYSLSELSYEEPNCHPLSRVLQKVTSHVLIPTGTLVIINILFFTGFFLENVLHNANGKHRKH